MNADFSDVRIHDSPQAAASANAINARAYTVGNSIAFASGQYAPDSTNGQTLLAHELTHVVQQGDRSTRVQRQEARESVGNASESPAENAQDILRVVTSAMEVHDVPTVVASLRQKTIQQLISLRQQVRETAELEDWLARHSYHAMAEEGLRLIWVVLPLLDRLEVYDEGFRELEQSQLDAIRLASPELRAQAALETIRLNKIYDSMSAKEEYQARVLIDPSSQSRYLATEKLLKRAEGIFSDEEDPVFDAILDLIPNERARFVREHEESLASMLSEWQMTAVRAMASGDEAAALIARLELATSNRLDDQQGIETVVNRAIQLLRERNDLQIAKNRANLPAFDLQRIDERLKQLEKLDELLKFNRNNNGELSPESFMGKLAEAREDPNAFLSDLQRFAQVAASTSSRATDYNYDFAKQALIVAGDNLDAARSVLLSIHATPVLPLQGETPESTRQRQLLADVDLRTRLLSEPDVIRAQQGLTRSESMMVRNAVSGDSFSEALERLARFHEAANWGEFFSLLLVIAQNEEWNRRFDETKDDPFGLYARVRGETREIMMRILIEKKMPLDAIASFTHDTETLSVAFASMTEAQRSQLRQGWMLVHKPPGRSLTNDELNARAAYLAFEQQVRESQTSWLGSLDEAGFEKVLGAGLGSEPTAEELSTYEGRYRAASLMYERVSERLSLGRGLSSEFSESDEAMVAAGREFSALWLRLRDRNGLSMLEFSMLVSYYQRFDSRAEEFSQASNTISEFAGTIAATVAAIAVVAATGGAATPAVIALAAASGAGSRVITREMFGDQYYSALSDQGARDSLLGAVDGALAVVGSGLASRGSQLLGLSGGTLVTRGAALADEVAESAFAVQSLGRRMATGAVEGAIDGVFSGAVSQAFVSITDERNWRRGIMNGLARVWQDALTAGLAGLIGGALSGAVMPAISSGWKRLRRTGDVIDEDALVRSETQAAREASVATSGNLNSDQLTNQQLANELDDLAAHPERLHGDPPARRAKVGRHEWVENPGNRWCRFSPLPPVCIVGEVAPEWKPHSEFQMPAAEKGRFLGDVGNSPFQLSAEAADAMGLPRGSSIPWRKGIPDFHDYAVSGPGGIPSSFSVPGLAGEHAADRILILQYMAAKSGMSQREIKRWLSTNNVRLHHVGGDAVQIVPANVHSLHHSGGAQQLRGI